MYAAYRKLRKWCRSLKTQSCHDANISFTGRTRQPSALPMNSNSNSIHERRQIWYHDNSRLSLGFQNSLNQNMYSISTDFSQSKINTLYAFIHISNVLFHWQNLVPVALIRKPKIDDSAQYGVIPCAVALNGDVTALHTTLSKWTCILYITYLFSINAKTSLATFYVWFPSFTDRGRAYVNYYSPRIVSKLFLPDIRQCLGNRAR